MNNGFILGSDPVVFWLPQKNNPDINFKKHYHPTHDMGVVWLLKSPRKRCTTVLH